MIIMECPYCGADTSSASSLDNVCDRCVRGVLERVGQERLGQVPAG